MNKINKKGFTLVELSVVMAVTALIVTMVCVFISTYYRNTNDLSGNDELIEEMSRSQSFISKWIGQYDGGYYDITVEDGGKTLHATPTVSDNSVFSETKLPTEGKLRFEEDLKKLSNISKNESEEFSEISGMTFAFAKTKNYNDAGQIEEIESENKSLVICTVTNGEIEQKMIFAFHSINSRSRYSSESRTDVAKVQNATDEFLSNYGNKSKISAENGKLSIGNDSLYIEKDGTVNKLCWKKQALLIPKCKYYGLVSATGVSYSLSADKKTLTCEIKFDSTTEKLEWTVN